MSALRRKVFILYLGRRKNKTNVYRLQWRAVSSRIRGSVEVGVKSSACVRRKSPFVGVVFFRTNWGHPDSIICPKKTVSFVVREENNIRPDKGASKTPYLSSFRPQEQPGPHARATGPSPISFASKRNDCLKISTVNSTAVSQGSSCGLARKKGV
jgi:hypothetical protein